MELEGTRKRIANIYDSQSYALTSRGADGRRIQNLRSDLRHNHLLPIARKGRDLLEGMPGINESLRVPHARAKDDEQLAAAKRIAEAVRPFARAFVRAKFKKNFITQLERAAAALERGTASTDTMISRGSQATADLRRELAHARKLIATVDSLVVAEFWLDKDVLSLWRNAKRIPRQLGRPRKKDL